MVAVIALFFLARLRYPGKPPVKLSADHCDSSLWEHVYQKDRLHVIEACTAVEGRVVSMHKSQDGDLHISLDPDRPSVLNMVNRIHGRGRLVVEIICDHPPAHPEEQTACVDFHPQITIPHAGDHVRITGAYVTDRDNGWNELHPVTHIEILH
jgi:hypothetical protein